MQLNKSFDKLRTNGNFLIRFVVSQTCLQVCRVFSHPLGVSLSSNGRYTLNQRFLKDISMEMKKINSTKLRAIGYDVRLLNAGNQ